MIKVISIVNQWMIRNIIINLQVMLTEEQVLMNNGNKQKHL